MNDYIIMTDSSCDLPAQLAQELELTVLPLVLTLDGKNYLNYLDEREITFKACYQALREGKRASTSAANVEAFTSAMEAVLQQGKDLLYIGFSSALSGTYNAGRIAAEQLAERYPERKLFVVDSLSASLGQGLLLYYVVRQKRAGATVEQARDYAEQQRFRICHWFTVDDLNYLHRGGRVSATSAVLGTVLNIKPVLHMDEEGRLIFMEKVRGRRNSIKRMLEKLRDTAIEPEGQTVYIVHGDCLEDAEYLAERIREEWGVKEIVINYVGPVIGAHTGPGVLSVFFVGTHR